VPGAVGRVLLEAGHEVILLRNQLAPDSPDPLVASVSEMNEAILVSHDKDFKTLAPRVGIGQRRFRRLSRIAIRCKEPQAANRIKAALSLIVHEWGVAQASSDKRMIVEVGHSSIRTIR
jgi:predicted nuclease of predicted toxin-antitoxin system